MDLLEMPITLVVKAPNQKIADHTVECGLDWTIKKLKQHLSSSYPSKPGEHQQKLIYSGKLLHDHLQLKDVLRRYEKDQSTHTVHLVCSQLESNKSANQGTTSTSYHSNQAASSTPTRDPDSYTQPNPSTGGDGIRHRNVHTDPSSQAVPQTPQEAFHFQQYYGANPMNMMNPMMYGNFFPGMMSPGMMSPEQMVAMQQMYAQQMAQYMQLYHQHNIFTPPGTPVLPQGVETPATPAPRADEQIAREPAANARRGADPVQVMNAQGGVVFDDDEEEENRDWLDWIYTFSRLAVLLGIVYFYSTLSRFFLVFSFFFMVYVYQKGWFQLRRQVQAEPAVQQQQPAPREEPQVPPEPEPEPRPDNESTQEEGTSPSDSDGDNEVVEDSVPTEVAPPAAPTPSALAVALSFFTTFFSSLVPQQPPGVNAN